MVATLGIVDKASIVVHEMSSNHPVPEHRQTKRTPSLLPKLSVYIMGMQSYPSDTHDPSGADTTKGNEYIVITKERDMPLLCSYSSCICT